jgi:hypothetical protein
MAAVMALPQFPVRDVDQVRIHRVADAMLQFGLLKRPLYVGPMIS